MLLPKRTVGKNYILSYFFIIRLHIDEAPSGRELAPVAIFDFTNADVRVLRPPPTCKFFVNAHIA